MDMIPTRVNALATQIQEHLGAAEQLRGLYDAMIGAQQPPGHQMDHMLYSASQLARDVNGAQAVAESLRVYLHTACVQGATTMGSWLQVAQSTLDALHAMPPSPHFTPDTELGGSPADLVFKHLDSALHRVVVLHQEWARVYAVYITDPHIIWDDIVLAAFIAERNTLFDLCTRAAFYLKQAFDWLQHLVPLAFTAAAKAKHPHAIA
jgi:hypothetical protein